MDGQNITESTSRVIPLISHCSQYISLKTLSKKFSNNPKLNLNNIFVILLDMSANIDESYANMYMLVRLRLKTFQYIFNQDKAYSKYATFVAGYKIC